jgi:hypothetical protein
MKQLSHFPLRWPAVFILGAALVTPCLAQVYQWKDAKGHTVISDSPPPGKVHQVQTVENSGGTTAEADAPPEKTVADQKTAYEERQKAAKDKADKEAKEKQTAADKKENCERAKRYLATLQSGVPLSSYDKDGKQQLIDDTQRQSELERARKSVDGWCH